MYQCCLCWEYCKHYNETCPWCGAEAVVMVTDEDRMECGYLLNISSYALSVLPRK
jgi:ribosomal protein S27AE